MKKPLSALVLLVTLNAFAQEPEKLKIINSSYPDLKTSFTCVDTACKELRFVSTEKNVEKASGIISVRRLNEYAERSLLSKRRDQKGIYDTTEANFDQYQKDLNEGFIGKAIGNALMTMGSATLETLAAPGTYIANETSYKKVVSRKEGKTSRTIKSNLDASESELEVNHKKYLEIQANLKNLSSFMNSEAYYNSPEHAFVSRFWYDAAHVYCYVQVAEGYYQFYVQDRHLGNFLIENSQEVQHLVSVLTKKIEQGICPAVNQ